MWKQLLLCQNTLNNYQELLISLTGIWILSSAVFFMQSMEDFSNQSVWLFFGLIKYHKYVSLVSVFKNEHQCVYYKHIVVHRADEIFTSVNLCCKEDSISGHWSYWTTEYITGCLKKKSDSDMFKPSHCLPLSNLDNVVK